MPAWNDLLNQLEALPNDVQKGHWIRATMGASLRAIRQARGDRNVILYGSAFLQKTNATPALLQITHEEINGFMSVIYGMNCAHGLTLVLHTPGGVTNAAETLVAYLWSKFPYIEVIVPTYAMSAGTMISLASNRIIMGRQSQLGPIDPQIPLGGGRYISARSITDQFERARKDVIDHRETAHAWAPVLQALGPGLLQEAQNAQDYGEQMVSRWLQARMFEGQSDASAKANRVAGHFNDAAMHKSHGRRIDRDEARSVQVVVEDLEDDQSLQEAVLTAYHVMTITFEKSPAAKLITSDGDKTWVKNA